MSKKKQIDEEVVFEETQDLVKLIDQNNAVINHQMKEVTKLVKEMNKKAKENNDLIEKSKKLLEQIQIESKSITQQSKKNKKLK